MHIGFLTPEYPHTNAKGRVAGIGTSIKNLTSNFVLLGHKVSVFIYGQIEDATYIEENINIIHIKITNKKFLNWYWARRKIEKVINNSVNNDKLEILEAPDWTGITSFMNIKCKHVIRLHGSDAYFCKLDKRKQKQKNFYLEKKALLNANSIVSVSKYTADVTKKIFNIKKDINVIHNGIDLKKFTLPTSVHIEKNTILYYGTLIRKKGVLEIPLILSKLNIYYPDVKIILIGNDSNDVFTGLSTWAMMQKLCSKDILSKLKYLGPLEYSKMREAILTAKLCIFPSYAEAFPVAWLEAMACKKPVVASNIGWAKEAIEDGKSGLLCSPNDHEEYANCIKKILDDEKYANYLAQNARERIEVLFDAEHIAKLNIEYYKKIILGI